MQRTGYTIGYKIPKWLLVRKTHGGCKEFSSVVNRREEGRKEGLKEGEKEGGKEGRGGRMYGKMTETMI